MPVEKQQKMLKKDADIMYNNSTQYFADMNAGDKIDYILNDAQATEEVEE